MYLQLLKGLVFRQYLISTAAAIAASLIFASPEPLLAETPKLFIFAGQSNMVGVGDKNTLTTAERQPLQNVKVLIADPTYAPPQPFSVSMFWLPPTGVLTSYTPWSVIPSNSWNTMNPGHWNEIPNSYGPEFTTARDIADALGEKVYIVKYAVGGSYLYPTTPTWNVAAADAPGNPVEYRLSLYHTMLAWSQAALNAARAVDPDVEISGFFWMQGESDAFSSSSANAYQSNFTTFKSTLRSDLGRSGLPFVFGKVPPAPAIPTNYRNIVVNAQANVAAADPMATMVNTDDLPIRTEDNIHFTDAGLKTLGQRFAQAWLTMSESIDTTPPGVPTNVAATPQSAASVKVTWSKSVDNVAVTGYRVHRNGSVVATTGTKSFIDTGLTPNTTYSYTVSAYDPGENCSAQSSPAVTAHTVSADSTPPSVPSSVTATPKSDTSIQINWNASTDNVAVGGYKVYRSGNLVGTSNTTSYIDSALLPNTTYSYTVAAYDGTGNSSAQSTPPKAAATLNAVSVTEVGPEYYVAATFDLGSTTFIDRTYTITSMPTKYRGLRGIRTANNDKNNIALDCHFTISQPSNVYVVLRASLTPSTPLMSGFVDTGDKIYTTDYPTDYKVWKKAYPAGLVSLGPKPNAGDDKSMYFVLVGPPDTAWPSVPQNVAAVLSSETTAQVTWAASTGATGYKIFRNGAQVGSSSTPYFTNTGLSPGTAYAYTVSAYNAGGSESAQSSAATVITPGSISVSNVVPVNYQVSSFNIGTTTFVDRSFTISSMPQKYCGLTGVKTANDDKDNASLDFHFTLSQPANVYLVMRNVLSPTTRLLTGFVNTGDTIQTTDLTPNYTVWMKTCPAGLTRLGPRPNAGDGNSMYFVLVGQPDTTDTQAPSIPTNVQASALSATTVGISWTASTDNVGVTGYKVYRNSGYIGTSTLTSYTDLNLQPNTTYSYTVSAHDAAGNNSAQSSPAAVATTLADTQSPSVPTDVAASALSTTGIRVSWTASTDNFGVTGYKVYRNGAYVGLETGPMYNDTGLEPGTDYSYTVSAYDEAGNESAQSSPPAVALTLFPPVTASVDLGSADVNDGLARVAFGDGSTGPTIAGGLNCRLPSSASNQYFYFAIDDSFMYNGNVETAYLEVCYYDDLSGGAFIEPQYDAVAGEYTALAQVPLTGTGKWKTAAWTLTDCLFANRQNGGADFRLYVGPNLVKIDSVRISKIPYSLHGKAERDLGINEVYSGLSHPQHSDGNTVVQLKDGVYCKRSSAAGNNYFYFNVSDAVIYDNSSPTVYLKVGYYDSPDGSITPEYDSTSGEYSAASTLSFAGTETWKEHIWTLHNVKFANRQNASADFRLYVGTAQDVFIDTVVISKAPFGDVSAPSVPADVTAETLSASSIRVSWAASTDDSEVAAYRVFRGSIEIGGTTETSYTDTGLNPGATYSYTVSAYDLTGNQSLQSSPPALATTITPIISCISAAKELPDATLVRLESIVVTAIYKESIYVEELDRNSGIRIVPLEMPGEIVVGCKVDIIGEIQTSDSGQRYLSNATVAL